MELELCSSPRHVGDHLFHQILADLRRLLEATDGHVGVPPETRFCLRQMAGRVQELWEAGALVEPGVAVAQPGHEGVTAAAPADFARSEQRAALGKQLVGPDLYNRSVQRPSRPASDSATDGAGPSRGSGVPTRPVHDTRPPTLTVQERRVLELLKKGHTNREIAAGLYLAEKTVKNYVSTILRKTGMERRTQVAVYFMNLDHEAAVPGE